MIDIKPNDFHNDCLYTKMEELKRHMTVSTEKLDLMNKDFAAVQKYLAALCLFKSYSVCCEHYALKWNNDIKKLGVEGVGKFINILECKLETRLEAHKRLPYLLDLIIDEVSNEHAI